MIKETFQKLKKRYEEKQITFLERWLFIPVSLVIIDVKYFFKQFRFDFNLFLKICNTICFAIIAFVIFLMFIFFNDYLKSIKTYTEKTSDAVNTNKLYAPKNGGFDVQ